MKRCLVTLVQVVLIDGIVLLVYFSFPRALVHLRDILILSSVYVARISWSSLMDVKTGSQNENPRL